MASRVQHRRSSVAGNIPDPGDLQVGEISVNFGDRYIYTKNGANAVIKMNGFLPLAQPVDETAGDSYIDPATGKLYAYFELDGDPFDWHEIAPPEDLSIFVKRDGSVPMTGALQLSGTATNNEAIGFNQTSTLISNAVANYVKKDGTVTMTGHLPLVDSSPMNATDAASKGYVDAQVAIATPNLDDYLAKVGGVMTGQITLPGGGTGNQAVTANELAAGFAAHVALPDPHTQYATNAELTTHKNTGNTEHPLVTTSVHGFMSSTDKTRFDTVTVAADADVTAGTDNEKYITPLRLDTFLTPILRVKLTANTTWYVRTDGSDSNDGSANDAGHAFLTIQKAINVISTYDINGFIATIQVADGTYTTPVLIRPMVGLLDESRLLIKGNISNASAVLISTTSDDAVVCPAGAMCTLQYVELRTTTSGVPLIAEYGGTVAIDHVVYGVFAGAAHMLAIYGGTIKAVDDYTAAMTSLKSPSSAPHMLAQYTGRIIATGIVITFTDTGLVLGGVASAAGLGFIDLTGTTYVGSYTGGRGLAITNGVVIAASGLPGNSGGGSGTGGQLT